MGMYDTVVCRYPLPGVAGGETARSYQTKSLFKNLDLYEITADGSLMYQAYEIEDRSDPKAEGLERLCGTMTRVNLRWEPCPHTGEVLFYDGQRERNRLEFSAYFANGKLEQLHRISQPILH